MANAVLGTNLVDSLVGVVDGLRSSLYPAMGVRQYQVRLVKRVWSGGTVGDGTAAVTTNITLDPQPLVKFTDTPDRLDPGAGCGRVAAGFATLREVSLQMSEDELFPVLTAGQEFYYAIEDAQGQSISTDYWIPTRKPSPDREKDIGWVVYLRRYEPG